MADTKELNAKDLVVGGKYNWRYQPERLVYMGTGSGGSRGWHQFELITRPGVVWCEVTPDDVRMLEVTK